MSKKHILNFLIATLLGLPGAVHAQTDALSHPYVFPKQEVLDTAIFKVVYEWVYEHPMSDAPRVKEYTLLVGPRVSKYAESSALRGDSLQYAERNSTMSYMEWLQLRRKHDANPREAYLLRLHQKKDSVEEHDIYMVHLSSGRPSFTEFYYRDGAANPAWTPTGRTKSIAGIECTEATGHLHGRQWTIWFAESIPIFEGPWELSGAPGLILEAYDADNAHQFTLIEMHPDSSVILKTIKDDRQQLSRRQMREQRAASAAKLYDSANFSPDERKRILESLNFLDLD